MCVALALKARYIGCMSPLKAIIFDLDGTLIHSAPDLQFAANEALEAIGRQPLDLSTIISFIGNGVEVLVERILRATGGSDEALRQDVLDHFLKIYTKNMTTLTRPYSGVVAALEEFQSAGIRLGICTNKPTQPALDICEQLHLAHHFDVIKGAESGQPKKPDPSLLIRCIEDLGFDATQAIYVGDSAVDYHTACNASVAFRLFSGGYLNESLPDLRDQDRFDDWATHGILTS